MTDVERIGKNRVDQEEKTRRAGVSHNVMQRIKEIGFLRKMPNVNLWGIEKYEKHLQEQL